MYMHLHMHMHMRMHTHRQICICIRICIRTCRCIYMYVYISYIISFEGVCENSRHPKTHARGLGGSVLRLLTAFPLNPLNPGMSSRIADFCVNNNMLGHDDDVINLKIWHKSENRVLAIWLGKDWNRSTRVFYRGHKIICWKFWYMTRRDGSYEVHANVSRPPWSRSRRPKPRHPDLE